MEDIMQKLSIFKSYPEIGMIIPNIWNKKIIEKLNLKIVVPSDRMYKMLKKVQF